MIRLALMLALIPIPAQGGDSHDKLKRAYVLNGYSMIGWVDLTKDIPAVRLIPTVPIKSEKPK